MSDAQSSAGGSRALTHSPAQPAPSPVESAEHLQSRPFEEHDPAQAQAASWGLSAGADAGSPPLPPAGPPFKGHSFSNVSIYAGGPLPVQTQLTIGQPNDPYEQEADRVADQVLRMADPPPPVQRQDSEEVGLVIRRSPDPAQPTAPQPNLETRLNASRSGGSPLPNQVRQFMEPRFGFDFSKVKVHNDADAVQMNRELGAQAFAHGNHIYYGAGKTPANDHLTGHELTHVVQQQTVSLLSSSNRPIAPADDVFERETTTPAEEIVSPAADPAATRNSFTIHIQRQVAEDESLASRETDEDLAPAERIDRVDGFLADRVGLFTIQVWGEHYHVTLDRTQNTWSERYTLRALTAAAGAAVVRYMTNNPPPAARIDAVQQELLREQRLHIEVPATLGPPLVDPKYTSRVERGGVSTLITRLGLELSDRGRQLEEASELGAFLAERLIEVAQNFGSVRGYLDDSEGLHAAELTSDHVFTVLTEVRFRSTVAELAKTDAIIQVLGRERSRDWTALTPEQWARALTDITVWIAETLGRAALERQERQRRHQLNEQLRPHRLRVPAAESARFILETYDPDSSVTVNFLGPVAIEGGQFITNAQRQQLFILRAGSQVIYQNLSDHRFYQQSAQGIQQELVYGVFALVAENTKYIIPITQFMLDVAVAIFPPARLPYLAVNVLNAGSGISANKDELLRLAENLQISRRAIDELLPGLLGKAIRATVMGGLGELFYSRYTTATPKQILLLVLRIASAAVRGSAAGRQTGKAAKAAWAEIRKELRSLGGLWAQVQALIVRQLSAPESWDEHPIEQLTRELQRLVGDEGIHYARLLISMDETQIERLMRETDEIDSNGTALVNLVASALSW